MKIFGVDVSGKFIAFNLEGEQYTINFRDSLRKGVYDISVWKNGKEVNAEITGSHPPLKEWLPEIWRIWFPTWCKRVIVKFRQLHSR